MKLPIISSSLAVLLLASSLSAQTILLREDFTVSVPPAGWSQVKHNPLAAGWIKSLDNRAWHEDESSSIGACDDELISPVLDLSAYPTVIASFETELNWADWLANHPSGFGDGESDLYVRVNGGSWVETWTDTRLLNTNDVITVDLSAYVGGQANVEIALRYYGTYAHETWVNWFQVDDGATSSFTLAKAGNCPGPMTISVTNATISGKVVIFHGAAGSFTQTNPNRPCLGTTLRISNPVVCRVLTADRSGSASTNANMPAGACGRTVQAVDLSSCATSNTITL